MKGLTVAKPIGTAIKLPKLKVAKRTSIGTNAKPTNKSARASFKPYRGQGRP